MKRDTARELIALLPATQAEIAVGLGIGQSAVSRWITRLTSAPRWIRICDWRAPLRSGPPVAVYGVGSEPDEECAVVQLSEAERKRRWRAAEKELDRVTSPKPRSYISRLRSSAPEPMEPAPRGIPKRDPLTAAFFGRV